MDEINDYQRDQINDYRIVVAHLGTLSSEQSELLMSEIAPYLEFRRNIDAFLAAYFAQECTATCFQSQLSACCAKDSIIIFFADVVINTLISQESDIMSLMDTLARPNNGKKCVYLGADGCRWKSKPIVCATFLCDRVQEKVFCENKALEKKWEALRAREKIFKWPDQPVLFDHLEHVFIKAGYKSPSMYLNYSPGLLRVKQQAGLISTHT